MIIRNLPAPSRRGPTAGPIVPLDWKGCEAGLQCATMRAPLDYEHPDGPGIDVFVARRPAGDPARRIGVLYVNPGGPGAPAYELLRDAIDQVLSPETLARFDIIAMDPRGTLRSRPLNCEQADVEVRGATLDDLYTAIGEACQQTDGPDLPFINTVETARDMDRLRVSLGEAKISYAGFSYGGYLGAVYASAFPGSLRAIILDSGVDPDQFGANYLIGKMKSWERALGGFLDACTTNVIFACPFNDGTDLRVRFDTIVARLGDSGPATTDLSNTPRFVFESKVLALLSEPAGWPALAGGLNLAAAQTRPADIARSVDVAVLRGGGPRESDVDATKSTLASFAIFCRDGILPSTPEALAQVAAAIPTSAPHFRALATNSSSLSVCAHWPVRPRPPQPLTPLGSPPILLFGSTLDLLAPVEWSQALAVKMGGPLVIRSGAGHVAMGRSKCINAFAQAFLIDLAVPPASSSCDFPTAAPTPGPAPAPPPPPPPSPLIPGPPIGTPNSPFG